jgi:hypothetical protein
MVKYHGSSRGLPRTTHNVATRVTQVLQAHAAHSALLGKRSVHPPPLRVMIKHPARVQVCEREGFTVPCSNCVWSSLRPGEVFTVHRRCHAATHRFFTTF